jgi:hypothetical protein
VLLGQLGGLDRRRRHQRSQAGLARARESHKALAHDAPVLVAQRDEVADGGERRQVEVLVGGARVGACGAVERLAELQDHPGGTQLGAAVGPERRMDERAIGQPGPRAVMVGDHHVQSRRPRLGHLLDGGHAAVDRHQQVHPPARKARDGRAREAIALVEAARQLPDGIAAQRAQRADEHGGGAHAVHVVVAEHRDPRAPLEVAQNQLAGGCDTGNRERVMALAGGQKAPGLLDVGEAAAGQNRAGHA